MVSPKKDNGNWVKPAGMTPDQFSYLADLDIDVLEQPEVGAIARIC
jgi:hypothetical protein